MSNHTLDHDQQRQLIEQQLGIHFENVPIFIADQISRELEICSHFLNAKYSNPALKNKPVLSAPLNETQAKWVDQSLGPVYASQSIALQDKVKDIPIKESLEPMVPLRPLFESNNVIADFTVQPYPEVCGERWGGKPRVFWLRKNVANKLLLAIKAFNQIGLKAKIEDAYRPVGVQEALFQRRITQLVDKSLPPEQQWSEARSKTGFAPWVSGHKWGASVDLTLHTLAGEPLDLGNKYGQGGALVAIECPYITASQLRTRTLFETVMGMVGLTVYPFENWHASSGDSLAAVQPDKTINFSYQTQYSPLFTFDGETDFDLGSGQVFPDDKEKYYQPFSNPLP